MPRRSNAEDTEDYYGGPRRAGTAIYYLLEPGTFSEMHKLKSDELFHFYAGDPVEQIQLFGSGAGERILLGSDLAAGQRPQVVVRRGVWQGARLVEGGAWALLGCTVTPGFEYADYEEGDGGGVAGDVAGVGGRGSRVDAGVREIHAT